MKRYDCLYTDGANYKTPFTVDLEDGVIDPEDFNEGEIGMTLNEIGYTYDRFFEEVVGFSYNEAHDHDYIEVLNETLSYKGVYIMNSDREQSGKNFIDALEAMSTDPSKMAYAIISHRDLWIIEQPGKQTYLLDLLGIGVVSSDIQDCVKAIDKHLDGGNEKIEADLDTDKYLIAYEADNSGDTYQHYEYFLEPYKGMLPKELAQNTWALLNKGPEVVKNAFLCKIISSTDQF
jgi:hypothetical protein